MKNLYVFDSQYKLIGTISQKNLLRLDRKEEIRDNELPLDIFTAEFKWDAFKNFEDIYYFAVKSLNDENAFHFYFVQNHERNTRTVILHGTQLAYRELDKQIKTDIRPSGNAKSVMTSIVNGTGWRVGFASDTQTSSFFFYYVSALEALKEVSSRYGLQLEFKVEISGQRISDKWIEAHKIGEKRSMKRFTHKHNALEIVQKLDRTELVTALIGLGKGEKSGDGYGRSITFADIKRSIAEGDEFDKPLGQVYVEDKKATQLYGIKNPDGTMSPAIGIVKFDEVNSNGVIEQLEKDKMAAMDLAKTEEEKEQIEAEYDEEILLEYKVGLLNDTWEQLKFLNRDKIEFSSTVADFGECEIAEVVSIHNYEQNIHYETNIFEKNTNFLAPSKSPIRLGDKIILSRAEKKSQAKRQTLDLIKDAKDEIVQETITYVTSADGKNVINYTDTEPTQKRVGDSWVRQHPAYPEHTQWLIWNGTNWDIVMDSSVEEQLQKKIEANTKLVNDAKSAADAASAKVDTEVTKVSQNIVNLTKDLSDSIAEVDTTSKNNYGELTGKVTDLTTALSDKPDKTYVDQTIDEKTGTITQTIGQIETKVNELDAVPVYTIGSDGYWYKDGVKTSTLAVGKDGQSGADGSSFTWNMIKGTKNLTVSNVVSGSDATFTNNPDGSITYQTNTTKMAYSVSKIGGLYPVPNDLVQEDVGKDFVFSIEMKSDKLISASIYLAIVSVGYVPLLELDKAVGKWHRVWFTAKVSTARTLQPHFQINTLNANVSFRNPMLHLGTIPAPYAPHISEIQGADGKDAMFVGATPPTDTTIAWLDTNTNSVKRFYNGAWYDINSEIKTKLNTVVDTVDTHTRTIAQVNADLKNRVEKSTFSTFKQEYDKIVSTVQKTETDLSGLRQSTTTQLNEQKQTLDANISKISNIEKDLTSGTTFQKIQTIKQTADGNKTTIAAVKKTADGAVQLTNFNTTINTVKESISTIGKKVDNNQTAFNEFKRTAEQTLSVISDPTKKGLISVINQQAGQILMQVGNGTTKSRLNLTKDGTYIDNALIESAHIKDAAITTAKIGNAQIVTAKIADAAITSAKILNLDVNKVSGLTSEFVRSKWNAINSSVTLDGNGMYIDGDWGGAINFTRRGQTFYDKIKGQVMGYQYGLYRNADDPLVNSQMLGIYLASEMGYDLRLGIRKQIDNQNNVYMAIKSAGGTATRADVFGATTFFNGINLNGTALTNASNAGYTSSSNPNGNCIEFNNGFKIQFKRMSYTTRSTGFEGWRYPKPFSAIPYTFGNAVRDDATAANANIAFSNVNTTACNVRISEKTTSYSILVCAIGF